MLYCRAAWIASKRALDMRQDIQWQSLTLDEIVGFRPCYTMQASSHDGHLPSRVSVICKV